MKKQLLDKEESFKKLLAELCQPLETTAQQWPLRMKELEDRFQEVSIKLGDPEALRGTLPSSHKALKPYLLLEKVSDDSQPNLKHDVTFQQLQSQKTEKKKKKGF